MKKSKFIYAMFLFASLLVSCDSDNAEPSDNNSSGTEGEDTKTEKIQNGFYVINNGNMSSNIASSITAYDYATGVSTPTLEDAFMNANGIALGEGACQAIIYDGKMFIPMTDSNILWVVDATTLKKIATVKFSREANSPRDVVAVEGKIYVSMFTGHVCKIDPETYTIEKTIATGSNSEEMAVAGGKLYVANSDGYNYENGYVNGSISIIDLASFTESKIKDISKVLNPTDMVSNGTDVFVICKGDYATVPSMVKKIEGTDVVDVALGNFMAIDGNKLYVINNVYGVPREDMGFNVYNTVTLANEGAIAKQTAGTESWTDYPSGIAVDPVTGDIIILSYTLSDAGWAQYSEPCYANIYDRTGNFKKRIKCGVGALGVTFIHESGTK